MCKNCELLVSHSTAQGWEINLIEEFRQSRCFFHCKFSRKLRPSVRVFDFLRSLCSGGVRRRPIRRLKALCIYFPKIFFLGTMLTWNSPLGDDPALCRRPPTFDFMVLLRDDTMLIMFCNSNCWTLRWVYFKLSRSPSKMFLDSAMSIALVLVAVGEGDCCLINWTSMILFQ